MARSISDATAAVKESQFQVLEKAESIWSKDPSGYQDNTVVRRQTFRAEERQALPTFETWYPAMSVLQGERLYVYRDPTAISGYLWRHVC